MCPPWCGGLCADTGGRPARCKSVRTQNRNWNAPSASHPTMTVGLVPLQIVRRLATPVPFFLAFGARSSSSTPASSTASFSLGGRWILGMMVSITAVPSSGATKQQAEQASHGASQPQIGTGGFYVAFQHHPTAYVVPLVGRPLRPHATTQQL